MISTNTNIFTKILFDKTYYILLYLKHNRTNYVLIAYTQNILGETTKYFKTYEEVIEFTKTL